MKKHYGLRTKLFACFGFVLVVAALTAIYSLSTIEALRKELRQEVSLSSLRLDQSRQIEIGLATMRTALRGISLFSMSNNPSGVDTARATFEKASAQMREVLDKTEETGLSAQDAEAVRTIRSGLEQWMGSFPEFVTLCTTGHADEALRVTLQKTSPIIDSIQRSAAAFGDANRAARDRAIVRVEDELERNTLVTVVLTMLVFLAGGGAFPIAGRLVRVLKEAVGSLAAGAEQIACASAQISGASQSLAQGSSEQAASLEETSASAEEINAMAHRSAENAERAVAIVIDSTARVGEANRSLDLMLAAMAEISTSSDKISKIIKAIDEIAFQTNILALNAAVEAARAGDAGMGFAVVADEVRNLAQRSATAAKDTASLIEESMAKSHEGKSKVEGVASAIHAITEDAGKLKSLVDEVQVGSQEQARGIDQISRAVAQMQQVTQNTAASAEESASAALELNSQFEGLKAVADQLTAILDGGVHRV